MNEGILPKLRFEMAEQLFSIIKPSDEISSACTASMSTINFLNMLSQKKLLVDAIRYLAIALPRREAIWWACATRRRFFTFNNNDLNEQKAWDLVEDWVYNPIEEHRLKSHAIAEELEFKTPGAYGAMSVFWSGGNIAPAGAGQVIPPGPNLTGTAVGASILLMCAKGNPQGAEERQQAALDIGLDVAYGGNGLVNDLN
jgi:hypothetical protein